MCGILENQGETLFEKNFFKKISSIHILKDDISRNILKEKLSQYIEK